MTHVSCLMQALGLLEASSGFFGIDKWEMLSQIALMDDMLEKGWWVLGGCIFTNWGK